MVFYKISSKSAKKGSKRVKKGRFWGYRKKREKTHRELIENSW